MTKTITVTQLRKDIFGVMEATKVNKQITNIMLHGEVIAEIRPKVVEKIDWDQYKIDLEKAVKHLRKIGWKENKDFRKNFKFRKW
ncbi:MAG: hypothetical protein WC784_02130 [Candidatus Shapirobacteria bacterium]|jgi:ribosomal protein L7/L12